LLLLFSGGSTSLLANSQAARFAPRQSPERLVNQVRSVEVAQEKVLNAVQENGKSQLETLEAILAELRLSREEMSVGREEASKIGRDSIDLQTAILNELQHFKEDTNRQLRENTRSLKDATSEMSNTCDDLNRQMKALVAAMKASR
jgi:hypothetical protein